MIPDEAVEAAARALHETFKAHPEYWTRLSRIALQAAAPHLLREAWEAGCLEGLSYNPGYDDEALAQNPYKKERA